MIPSRQRSLRLCSARAALVFVVAMVGSTAHAQPTANDQSLAQSLFEQGKRLMQEERYAAACTKLQESQRLDPSGGTILNLALCREKEGKLATAWADYKTALSFARRDRRQDRIDAATERIAALEPKLPKLSVSVLEPASGQSVSVDGTELRQGAWGISIAVDPGSHVVRAQAPGKKPWERTVQIAVGVQQELEVPPLKIADSAPAPERASGPEPVRADEGTGDDGGSRTLGWVIGGTGLAVLGVGGYFGVRALDKRQQSDELCPTDTTCTPRGVELNDEAKTAAWVANVGVGVGLVGIGIGTYLLLRESSSQGSESVRARSGVTLDASVFPTGGRAVLSGKW